MAEIFFSSTKGYEFLNKSTVPKKQVLECELNKIEQYITQVKNKVEILDAPSSLVTTKEVTKALMAASVHQKEIVVQMMSSNPEDTIALSLAASIEAYGKQLESINAWMQGGFAVVDASLSMIFDNICQREDLYSYLYLEDLFQIVLIEFTLHAEEYGMADLLSDDDFMDAVGIILEFTGSSNHHDSFDDHDQKIIIDAYKKVYDELYLRAPNNSLMADAFDILEQHGGLTKLIDGMSDSIYDNNGDINDDQYLSPMLILTVLSISASSGDILPEQWGTIIFGDREVIEGIVNSEDDYDNLIHYIAVNQPSHEADEGYWIYNEGTGYWDYIAPDNIGYETGYLNRFFKDFPSRELTEDEIEEVNRIGDQVKMLQQTLLYWLKICRDEQMAMAQNI
ncbi:hypothetical protein C4C99_RS18820 [Vibrio parahaemolyticus]|uniref:hypothetical protein n=1 Tax=Vibrio parahaemolyticus TaxID=670 RepID=UPI0003F5AAF8|nr:hypothetical protein [Vibrio parahaemolyticus]KIT21708.1 molecular chaperone [Vibrio parahaemolyticus VP766]KIT49764.1 molecular chaperone [Vibrio parahaemolyticus 901128]EGQ8131809.1 hypothetical protein [Vibrio parahaemolyticus]EGQ8277619.1 hypothetical protein [Vibrio parahaemolyticus]EGQ8716385.1 hypothetical protein [Vibrio parahaemolyticus]